MFDDFNDLQRNTLADRLGLVSRPFELAVELTRRSKDCQFANPRSEPRLVPQIAVIKGAGYVSSRCRSRGRVQTTAARVTPFAVLTGAKWSHSGPASRLRISARNLADSHLSFTGMIV